MEPAPRGEAVRVQAKVSVEEEVVEAEWKVPARGLAPVESVSVLVVVRNCPIRQEYPVIV